MEGERDVGSSPAERPVFAAGGCLGQRVLIGQVLLLVQSASPHKERRDDAAFLNPEQERIKLSTRQEFNVTNNNDLFLLKKSDVKIKKRAFRVKNKMKADKKNYFKINVTQPKNK